MNAWACLLSSFVATLFILVIYTVLDAHYAEPAQCPQGVLLFLLLITVFLLQYAELPLMGKKMGVSLLAIYLLTYHDHQQTSLEVWRYFISVVIGCGFALVGVIAPLPLPRLAGEEVRGRLSYYCKTVSALLREEVTAWLHEPLKKDILEAILPSASLDCSSQEGRSLSLSSPGLQTGITQALLTSAQQRWRRLRLLLTAVIAFRRSSLYRIGWLCNSSFHAKSRYLRSEMIVYLLQELDTLRKRNNEALFEPFSRGMARRRFVRCLQLISTLLAILLHFERQISALETKSQYHAIFVRFFADPNFRRALYQLVDAVCDVLTSLFDPSQGNHLAATHRSSGGIGESSDYSPLQRQDEEIDEEEEQMFEQAQEERDGEGRYARLKDLAERMCRLVAAREEFEEVYFSLRNYIYYGIVLSPSVPGGEIDSDADCPPLLADVSFILNTSLFLLDAVGDHLLYFHRKDDLFLCRQELIVHQRFQDKRNEIRRKYRESPSGGKARRRRRAMSWRVLYWIFSLASSCRSLIRSSIKLFAELLPNQMPVLCVQYDSVARRWQWRYTPAIHARLLSAVMVSLAMTIAGAYGIYAHRPQVSLASFTIAYLAGGSASGINIMTCINRSIGTVLSCIYVVFVVFIFNSYKDSTSNQSVIYLSEAWLLGTTSVLFQLPATYVRSYPLYSYSGTVAGFTAALLLINTNLSTSQAIDRILDTFLGVAVYVALELAFFAQSSESVLLSDLDTFLKGVDVHFSQFHSHFQSLESRAGSTPRRGAAMGGDGGGGGGAEVEDRKLSLVQSLSSTNTIALDRLAATLLRQREMLPFYKSEPRLLVAPALPDRLLQEMLSFEDQALLSLQMMQFVVNKIYLTGRRRRRRRYLEVVQLYQDIAEIIRRLNAPPPPPPPSPAAPPPDDYQLHEGEQQQQEEEEEGEHSEIVNCHRQYREELSAVTRRREQSISTQQQQEEEQEQQQHQQEEEEQVVAVETDNITLSLSSSPYIPLNLSIVTQDDEEGDQLAAQQQGNPPPPPPAIVVAEKTHTLPDFEAMLLPLQPQFIKVEQLVSAALASLTQALLLLRRVECHGAQSFFSQYLALLRLYPASSAPQALAQINHRRFLQMIAQQHCRKEQQEEEQEQEGRAIKIHSLYFGEMRSEEIDGLFQDFQETIKSLQDAVILPLEAIVHTLGGADSPLPPSAGGSVAGGATTSSSVSSSSKKLKGKKAKKGKRRGPRLSAEAVRVIREQKRIASNDEMKVVCTLLEATQLLLSALQGLAKTISRLQAFRDISVTQDGL
eukprot:scaffold6743_cov158-Ochromonas_danica.AAC.16